MFDAWNDYSHGSILFAAYRWIFKPFFSAHLPHTPAVCVCVSRTFQMYQYPCELRAILNFRFLSSLAHISLSSVFFCWSFPQVHIVFRFQFVIKNTFLSQPNRFAHKNRRVWHCNRSCARISLKSVVSNLWPGETAKSNTHFASCAADNATSSFKRLQQYWVHGFNFTFFFSLSPSSQLRRFSFYRWTMCVRVCVCFAKVLFV